MLQRVDLADRISLEPGSTLEIDGFPEDTLVRDALLALAKAAAVEPNWSVRIEKRIPVAAGLGGGSSDAAAALRLANDIAAVSVVRRTPARSRRGARRRRPVLPDRRHAARHRRRLGAGARRAADRLRGPSTAPRGRERSRRRRTSTPRSPANTTSTSGALGCVAAVEARDLAALPPNDLASSPLAQELRAAGAFRADVSGAGPTVYGLFADEEQAAAARELFADRCTTWLTAPAW